MKMKTKQIYLREVVSFYGDDDTEIMLSIFEGDIEKDRKSWDKIEGIIVRYFKLVEEFERR